MVLSLGSTATKYGEGPVTEPAGPNVAPLSVLLLIPALFVMKTTFGSSGATEMSVKFEPSVLDVVQFAPPSVLRSSDVSVASNNPVCPEAVRNVFNWFTDVKPLGERTLVHVPPPFDDLNTPDGPAAYTASSKPTATA